MSVKPIAIAYGCPKCRGDLAYEVEKRAFCCQSAACDYSRPTLHPQPSELTKKPTATASSVAAEAPASVPATVTSVAVAPDAPVTVSDDNESFTLAAVIERWGVSEGTARRRLVKYGGLETVSSYRPIPREVVEKVEREVASWGTGGEPTEPQEAPMASAESSEPTFGLAELGARWKVTETGVHYRLKNIGNQVGVSRLSRYPLSLVEQIERTLAEREATKAKVTTAKVAAATEVTPRVESARLVVSEAPVPAERALVVAEKPAPPSDAERRIARLRLTLERIAELAKKDPVVAELAKLALDLDAVEG